MNTNAVMPIVTTLLLASMAFAANNSPLAGSWKGEVRFTKVHPTVILKVKDTAEGSLAGSVDLPDQNQTGMAVSDLKVVGDSVSFDLSNDHATSHFAGKLSAKSNSISGEFTQAGYSYPFELRLQNDDLTDAPR